MATEMVLGCGPSGLSRRDFGGTWAHPRSLKENEALDMVKLKSL
jgi:hypothetical protein